MKTKDTISKKRQKLRQELEFWQAKEADARAAIAPTEFQKDTRSKAVLFCRQEAAKRQEAMKKLEGGSKWQRINGWR